MTNRHPATTAILAHFAHLAPHLAQISKESKDLACEMVAQLPDDPELTAGLRKLLEAKDCFVRAAVVAYHKAEAQRTETSQTWPS